MRSKALYFPYINLPENDWLYLMLLYWDQLSSIMPSEYIDNPQKLSPHMSMLLREGLVNPVIPKEFIRGWEDFGEPFLGFVRHRVSRGRRTRMATTQRKRVHIEKLGRVADELVDLNLATPREYPWYEIDGWVADAFMTYLVSLIGSLPEVDSAPITNDESCFRLLTGYQGRPSIVKNRLRQLILKEVFPFPRTELNLNKLIKFKDKYGKELAQFRNRIEGLCIDLSNISDQNAREEKGQIIIGELKQDIDLIAARLRETWQHVVLLDISTVLGSSGSVITAVQGDHMLAAGFGALSLTGAVYRSFEKRKDRELLLLNHPMAYGALLKRNWTGLNRGRNYHALGWNQPDFQA